MIVNKSRQWDSPERERDVLGGSRMSRRRSNGLLPLFPLLEERRLLWFLTSDRWKGESDCWRRRMSPSMSSIPIPLMPCSVGAVFAVDAGEVNLPLPPPFDVDVKRGWSEDENKPSFDLGRMPDKRKKTWPNYSNNIQYKDNGNNKWWTNLKELRLVASWRLPFWGQTVCCCC